MNYMAICQIIFIELLIFTPQKKLFDYFVLIMYFCTQKKLR